MLDPALPRRYLGGGYHDSVLPQERPSRLHFQSEKWESFANPCSVVATSKQTANRCKICEGSSIKCQLLLAVTRDRRFEDNESSLASGSLMETFTVS